MVIVINAGGSGTRLWPLSTPSYPKHLLSIPGDNQSFLQYTYDRASSVDTKIWVVTESSHVNHVKKQLTKIESTHVICEPARRGTANCILAALVKLNKSGLKSDEAIGFIHADHSIRDVQGFAQTLKHSEKLALRYNKIVLVGVEPDYPATGFGYIQKGNYLTDMPIAYSVSRFEEKPDFDTAKSYLKSGKYLWNCGYFIGTLGSFEESMKKYSPDLFQNYKRLLNAEDNSFDEVYASLPDEAIDYALIEKVPDLLVVPAEFDWMDLGSFGDLSKAVAIDNKGNSLNGNVYTDEVDNSLIINNESKPLVVIGLDNIAVINTKDGVLVTRKDLSQKVGAISKSLNNRK